jgi:hypothetical protein
MRRKMLALALVLVAGQLARPLAQTQQWVKVAPPGCKCLAMMPTQPEDQPKTEDSAHGKYTTHLFLSRTDSAIYLLGWVDYPPDFHPDVQAEINANRDNFIKAVEAKLTSERKVSLDGYPGIEFMAESAKNLFKSRVYMVGDRPYQLIALWAKDAGEPPGVATFLNSFRLANQGK